METKEIAVLKKKVNPLIDAAESQLIESGKDMEAAVALVSNLGNYIDQLVAKREEITKPANLILKNARAMFDPIEKPAKAAYDALRTRIGAWQTAEDRRVKEEEAALAARVGEGKGNLRIETAARKAREIERPDAAVATDAGLMKFRTDQKLKITDETKIPRKFLVVDERALLKALKDGEKVAGAEIEEVQTPVNFR